MTITVKDVVDLQPGDVVEIIVARWLPGTSLTGPLWGQSDGTLLVGDLLVRSRHGYPNTWDDATLKVISRGPRPLYVNHPRAEPVRGDVVRDEDNDRIWVYAPADSIPPWLVQDRDGAWRTTPELMPTRLRLLVDGETRDVVPQE